ncbi:MAG: sulfite exporter TauE/SafE family protein [Candidatus Dojkabacteria bacterium]
MAKQNKPNKNKTGTAKPKKSQSCTLYIDGMHCASCEILIEKKLLKQQGVQAVDASMKDGSVHVEYTGDSKPDTQKLNKDFSNLGYKFVKDKPKKKKSAPLLSIVGGELVLNNEKFSTIFKTGVVVASLIIAFFIFEKMQIGQHMIVDASSTLPAFLLLGVVAGISSCAALIGGLLLSMTKQWNELYIDAETPRTKAIPHIMFHAGRIAAFTVFGGILGLIGDAISLNSTTFWAVLTIIVSGVMFVLAMQMLGVAWAQKLRFTAPKSLTRYAAETSNFKGKYMPFTVGALTFLLPCGFTLLAQSIALTSGSVVMGSLIMLLFSLGTLPTLLAITFSGLAFNSKPHLTAKFNVVAGLIVMFFVIYNVNGQLNVLGLPSLSDISFGGDQEVTTSVAAAEPVVVDGKQQLNFIAKGFDYFPTSSTTINAGVPTTMVVDNQGVQGCGAFIAARGLIDNYVALKSGINEIDLGSPKKGTYKVTCTMGMVAPVTVIVQ